MTERVCVYATFSDGAEHARDERGKTTKQKGGMGDAACGGRRGREGEANHKKEVKRGNENREALANPHLQRRGIQACAGAHVCEGERGPRVVHRGLTPSFAFSSPPRSGPPLLLGGGRGGKEARLVVGAAVCVCTGTFEPSTNTNTHRHTQHVSKPRKEKKEIAVGGGSVARGGGAALTSSHVATAW